MKLDPKSLAVTISLLWGGTILVTSILNILSPGYGGPFLDIVASVYPGYHPGGISGALLGTAYGLVDGAVGGWVIAWLYNKVSSK